MTTDLGSSGSSIVRIFAHTIFNDLTETLAENKEYHVIFIAFIAEVVPHNKKKTERETIPFAVLQISKKKWVFGKLNFRDIFMVLSIWVVV